MPACHPDRVFASTDVRYWCAKPAIINVESLCCFCTEHEHDLLAPRMIASFLSFAHTQRSSVLGVIRRRFSHIFFSVCCANLGEKAKTKETASLGEKGPCVLYATASPATSDSQAGRMLLYRCLVHGRFVEHRREWTQAA